MTYTVTTLPATGEVAEYNFDPFTRVQDMEWGVYRVRVVRVGSDDEWAIRRHLKYLVKDDTYVGTMEWSTHYDPMINRFTLEEALATAQALIWEFRVNGNTAADVIRAHYPELEDRIP